MQVEHPVMRFTRGKSGFESRVREIERAGDEQLRQMYLDEMNRGAVLATHHNRRVYAAMGLWQSTGKERYRQVTVRACRAMLGETIDAHDEQLRSAMDLGRGFTVRSRMARDGAYHFGLMYQLTRDKTYAHKAAVLLARLAEAMPNWPIQNPHFGPMEERRLLPRTWPGYVRTDRVTGLWGGWIYCAIQGTAPLAYAYDLIHDSDELQRMGALGAVERELNWAVEFQLGYGREMGNMDATSMRGLIEFGKLLGRPELVHHCVKWVHDMYQIMFFADGWWHEGTPSYHQQIHGNMRMVIRDYLQGYSDPPGYKSDEGVRYDNLDLFAMVKRPFARADAVLRDIHQPNGDYQCIHDTAYPQVNWEKRYIKEAKSRLSGCMGHCILGTGKGDNMVQATLHFSGIHGHAHYDTLNFMLFAKGKELISETRYRPIEGSDSTREWHTMTAGHVTVVIDEQNQSVTTRRKKQPTDAIPGIADGKYRWSSHGSHMVEGKLRIHNTDFDMVQVVEVDGERAYQQTKDGGTYRRLIALVKISDTDTYVVDIFRVRGGKVHDYLLHSCLADPHAVDLSVPLDQPMPGTEHKYIGNLRTGRTDGTWTATYQLNGSDAELRTWMLPQADTQIILGDAPAMRRIGRAPFLCARQTDGESIYVAVHHPFTDEPVVRDVQLTESSMDHVALRVILPGRVDTIISTGDRFRHRAEGHWTYEIGGEHAHTGIITKTYRVEAGDELDAFVTNTPLPTDGTLDGFTILIDLGGLLVQGFTIDHIERRAGETIIYTPNEPGMVISPGLVKLTYFPCWGISGEARFRINGVSREQEP